MRLLPDRATLLDHAAYHVAVAAGSVLRWLFRPLAAPVIEPVKSQAPTACDSAGDAFDQDAFERGWHEYARGLGERHRDDEDAEVAALDELFGLPTLPDTPETLRALGGSK